MGEEEQGVGLLTLSHSDTCILHGLPLCVREECRDSHPSVTSRENRIALNPCWGLSGPPRSWAALTTA